MARIAFAWELGGELGHAISCSELARSLTARGHQVAFVFRELHNLRFLPNPIDGIEVFQAPVVPLEGLGESPPATFADILRGCGYRDPAVLGRLVAGWREIFARWKPDLVVEDFAPTALLAARIDGLRRVRYGNGFAVPPRTVPLPAFRFDAGVAPDYPAQAEAGVLAVVNAALTTLGAAPLANLAEQLESDDEFLCTFPELDQYGDRPAAGYWGPRFHASSGEAVEWPGGIGKRIVVYLKRTHPALDHLIETLAASPHQVAAFIPDLEPQRRARLEGPRRIVAQRPIRLDTLLRQADLMVSHGGNICPGSLTRGIPQLVLPSQYEQYLTAVRVGQLRVGAVLPPEADAAMVSRTLQRLLEDPGYVLRARTFAARYPAYSPMEQRRRMCARIEQLAARA